MRSTGGIQESPMPMGKSSNCSAALDALPGDARDCVGSSAPRDGGRQLPGGSVDGGGSGTRLVERMIRILPALSAAWIIACVRAEQPPSVQPSAPVSIETTVRLVRAGAAEVAYVEVRSELRGTLDQSTRPLSFRAPIVYASVPGIADRTDSLRVRDASGDVPLTIENDPVDRGGFPFYRHWRAQRAVVPPVVLTYRMRPGTPRTGPQFDLYANGGGVSFGGMALFVQPEGVPRAEMTVRYDLGELAKGSIAASTHGEGDLRLTGSPDQLVQAYYMVGPAGVYRGAGSRFAGYWLGTPQFEPRRTLAWAERSYAYQREFFRDTSASSYRVFIRALPGAGGGTALRNSFMLAAAPGPGDSAVGGPRGTIAHEMGHMFVGGLAGGGVGGTPWFAEGLNVFYTRLLLLRSGLAPVSDYQRDVNGSARNYYSNPFRNASADSLLRLGFSAGVGAGSAQNVAYTRGSLYFADVDAKIRALSGGRRKLDDVILPLFERRRRGERIDQNALIDAFVAELGPSARDQFEAVIVRGETIVPDANAFGPCLERRATTFTNEGQRFEGYEWVRGAGIPDEKCREW
jgi:hypothetical protein